LKSRIFGWTSFKGCNQLTKVGSIYFEEDLHYFGVNRTELRCSSSFSGSFWSFWVFGSSSSINYGETIRSSTGSSNMVSWACLWFFLGAIWNSQEVNRALPELWY
jgi:hypothetical protein